MSLSLSLSVLVVTDTVVPGEDERGRRVQRGPLHGGPEGSYQ